MFLVGGGIVTHNVESLHHLSDQCVEFFANVPWVGGWIQTIGPILFDGLFGVVAGAVLVAIVQVATKLFFGRLRPAAPSSTGH
jgi:predicted DNA repair protein MutK